MKNLKFVTIIAALCAVAVLSVAGLVFSDEGGNAAPAGGAAMANTSTAAPAAAPATAPATAPDTEE